MFPFTKLVKSIWCWCFLSIFDFDSDSRPHFRPESVQRFIYFNLIGYFVHKRIVGKEQCELVFPFTKLLKSTWCRCFLSIFDFDSDSRPHFRPESVQRFIYFNKIGYFVHKRIVCKEQCELVFPFTKLVKSIWCRCFLSIFDFDSDSRPHFRPESVQRFIYFNKIGYFVHKRSVCKDHWELVSPCTKVDISIWCWCFLSIFDFDSDSRPHFRPESVQRFIYSNKIEYFVHKRVVCKEQCELVFPFTKLVISIWCRCFLSIFDFDSDSRHHFRPESVQRFIYSNKIGYFVHKRVVCKEQCEFVFPFTKLVISIWCRCFLSIFDFDSDSRPHFRPESVQRFIYSIKIGYFVHKRIVCKEQWELVFPFTKLVISIWCRCFLSIFDFDSDSRPHFRPESVQRFIYFNKIGYFVHNRSVCKDQCELVLPCTKVDISIWCWCFLSIFDFDSDSRPHFRPESVQRFIYSNKIGYFVHKRIVCKEQCELVFPFTKLVISIWCRCFLSIFDFDSDSRPHFRPESVQRFIYFNKIGYFVHNRSVCKDQCELVLPCTKVDISIWCWCFLSIFDFDSDSRPHFRPESVQRFIYSNKIGYFVHKRIVCKEQCELVFPFTKLVISIWCRCFLSFFDFDSDSRPHFRPESVQRFIYFNKIGYFVHKRSVCKDHWELVSPCTKVDISIWCWCFLSIFDFDSDSRPHFRPESVQRFIYSNKIEYFVHKRVVCKEQCELVFPFTKLVISIWCRCFLSIFDFDSDSRPHFRPESVQRFIYSNKIGYFVHKRVVCKLQCELVFPFTKLVVSIWCRCFLSISDFDSDSRPHFRPESVQRFIYSIKIGYFVHKRIVCKEQWELVFPFTKLVISIWCRCFISIFDFDSDSRPHFRPESVQRFIYFNIIGYFVHKRIVGKEQCELVFPFTKLVKSIWCWCFLSIFDFDSDSRPHFRPESVQRFIYFNIIGYFVHKRIVGKEQCELVFPFTKLLKSTWCRCFLSIFDFDSDSRPHFRPESVQRFIYFNKIGYFVHKRIVCKEQCELVFPFTKLENPYDADVFFQFSILIRILDLISDPNQSRDSYILI